MTIGPQACKRRPPAAASRLVRQGRAGEEIGVQQVSANAGDRRPIGGRFPKAIHTAPLCGGAERQSMVRGSTGWATCASLLRADAVLRKLQGAERLP